MDALLKLEEGLNDCIDQAEVMELMADGLDARHSKESYIVGWVVREMRKRLDSLRADLLALDSQLHQR